MNNSSAVSNANSDPNFENARDARARAWMYVFKCYTKKKATRPGGPDARKESNGSGKVSIP